MARFFNIGLFWRVSRPSDDFSDFLDYSFIFCSSSYLDWSKLSRFQNSTSISLFLIESIVCLTISVLTIDCSALTFLATFFLYFCACDLAWQPVRVPTNCCTFCHYFPYISTASRNLACSSSDQTPVLICTFLTIFEIIKIN